LTPPGKVQNFTFAYTDCNVTQGQECRQRWDSTIQLTPTTCTLDGQYQLSWSTACGAGLSGTTCPLLTTDIPTSVNFSLTSENFCAEVTVDVGLTGTLTSYSDNAYSTASSAFIVGRTGYFLVTVNSELNPPGVYNPATAVVTFSSTALIAVTVRQVSTTTIYSIFSNGTAANFASLNQTDLQTNCVQITNSDPSKVGFSFVFSTVLNSQLTTNGQLTFTIGATVQVTYTGGSKRGLLQGAASTNPGTYSTNADLMPDTTISSTIPPTTSSSTPPTTNPSTNPTTGSASVIFASMLLFLIAIIV
jgi:hypothetical protein